MVFREMISDDISAVMELFDRLFRHLVEETNDPYINTHPDADIRKDIRDYLESTLDEKMKSAIVAEEDTKIAGFICGEIKDCFFPPSMVKKIGYIFAAYTLPEFRNQGVMSTLEKILVDFFKSFKITYVELSFFSGNSLARKSWESMGYRVFREQMRKPI